jgi:transposase
MKGKQNHQVRVMARRTGASTTIIRQWTKEFHLKPYHIRRRFPSTAPTRAKRLKFATDYLKEPALVRNGIFVDECHFSLRKMPNRKNAIVYDTSAYNVPAVSKYQHESTVRVWGGISIHGKTNLVFYDGTLNADRYIDEVLSPELEPFCARIGKNHHCIMLQDNAPIHKSKKVQAWLSSSDIPDFIDAAEWPGYSPDLNPVEHIWAHLAERVHRSHVPNKEALARRLKKEWEKMDPCFVEKVCLSMKARLEQCIERAGRPTDY